ncbi:MarR family transcriptional regulator [Mycolicibacterium arabiense]|nr:MarR family transcriptional regulator [Mycolicibacterium arabiense]MCV7372014.1 MarR family transcriptional regulator [Mycolicibacterium arabiense]
MPSTRSTSFLLMLARCEQGITDLLRPTLNEVGISLEQWRVIGTLRQVEYMSMTTLSELSAVPASSLTRHVDQLIDMGAALRQVDPADRRKVVVALTKQGWRFEDKCAEAEAENLAKAMTPSGNTAKNLAELIDFVGEAVADQRRSP